MGIPEADTTPESLPTHPIPFEDPQDLVLAVLALTLAALFIIALIISLVAALCQLHAFLMPPRINTPEHVRIRLFQKFFDNIYFLLAVSSSR